MFSNIVETVCDLPDPEDDDQYEYLEERAAKGGRTLYTANNCRKGGILWEVEESE